jgi:hypothetical protein
LPPENIRKIHHDDYHQVQPWIEQLKTRSTARVAASRDYGYVREDIAEYQKSQIEKAATLNEAAAIREREKGTLKNKTRDKEREARPHDPATFYEISLADALKDGLPAPMPETTNSLAAAKSDGDTKKEPTLKPKPGTDPMLDEARNILNDYVSLLAQPNNVTQAR